MKISKHAKRRMKERCGFNRKSKERMARKAFYEGIKHGQTKGRLRKWVDKLYFSNTKANNIRLHGGKAYIFAGKTLITVIQIPANLMRDFKTMVKIDDTGGSYERDKFVSRNE